jgi:hypothetical protein
VGNIAGPALKILNPYYIRIATAVVTNNNADLGKYAARMRAFAHDKSKPYLWFPAMRARTFCLSRLDAPSAFVHGFAVLCHAQGNIRNQNKLLKFVPPVLSWLSKHQKSAWVQPAVAAALPASGPYPTRLYMYLLNLRLTEIRNPDHRINLIQQSIGQANTAIIDARKTSPPAKTNTESAASLAPPMALGYSPHLQQYRHALEQLRYLMVLNTFYVLKIRHLQAAAQVYLANYGTRGAHSPEVFYRMVDGLAVAYRVAVTPQRKAQVLLAGGWLNTWHQKFKTLPGPWQKPIEQAWKKWRSLEAAAGAK